MPRKVSPLPASSTRPITPSGTFDPVFYAYLKQLETVVTEQAAHIEILRLALNEARQNPTTVYPAVPAF